MHERSIDHCRNHWNLPSLLPHLFHRASGQVLGDSNEHDKLDPAHRVPRDSLCPGALPGQVHGPCLRGRETHSLFPQAAGEGNLSDLGDRFEPGDELEAVRLGAARAEHPGLPVPLPAPGDPEMAAAEPRKDRQHVLAPGAEHRGQLHDEHELAELRRGECRQLPLPDGGAGSAELPERRHGHGGPPGPRPRDRKQAEKRHHQAGNRTMRLATSGST